eukprot:9485117-Pyramimonas_sp.AAC.1
MACSRNPEPKNLAISWGRIFKSRHQRTAPNNPSAREASCGALNCRADGGGTGTVLNQKPDAGRAEAGGHPSRPGPGRLRALHPAGSRRLPPLDPPLLHRGPIDFF